MNTLRNVWNWGWIALLGLLCVASLGRADFLTASHSLSSSSRDKAGLMFAREGLTPLECYRDHFGKSLDLRILVLEIVEARLAIQEKLGLLDRFHYEVEFNDFLARDCLGAYRRFLAKERNLKGLQACNGDFVAALNVTSS